MQIRAFPNRLIHAKSPYLLQHAYNPVEWCEWGTDAITTARESNRPILLSIGYSACHWCHVMEHESFSDESIAALMNAYFVCIKVDREERPDIDAIYMTAVQRMTGHGGWPMTMFLTPEGDPFYGGTYYPPEDRGRMPGFRRVLQSVHTAWLDREAQLRTAAADMRNEIQAMLGVPAASLTITEQLISNALQQLSLDFDASYGGFGNAPKFPPAITISFLLRHHQRTHSAQSLQMATHTLDAMANSGLYDQLGGGFHRYSVDGEWQVPHFEKMLYDNGLLITAYAEAFQVTRNPMYARICDETITWAFREMQHTDGGFYSALDADSDGEEGTFYVWSASELDNLLEDDAGTVRSFYKVDKSPNFEHQYVLQRRGDMSTFATQIQTDEHALHRVIARANDVLIRARNKRTRPHCDTKIIASWNGLMIAGLATAGRYIGQIAWLDAAQKALDFVRTQMSHHDLLYRIWKDGDRGQTIGFLDDYANVADAALQLYTANGEPRNLEFATNLARQIVTRFYVESEQRLYDTSDLHEQLIVRPAERTDNATPSGTATAIDVLQRLSVIHDEPYFALIAEQLLARYAQLVERWPNGFGRILAAMERSVTPSTEIVIVGNGTLAATVHASAVFTDVIVYAASNPELTLCQNKQAIQGKQTVYVCRNYTCESPATNHTELLQRLRRD
ncbi:MAG: thioredoxin domain-containing protein [Chloroflexi bacterium]|nr:thioredoxin domain-containing protein [Chloroflexota bacterium]